MLSYGCDLPALDDLVAEALGLLFEPPFCAFLVGGVLSRPKGIVVWHSVPHHGVEDHRDLVGRGCGGIEKVDGNEHYFTWIAPELGCFPLRSQVLVDEWVRHREDTILLKLLPENTRLSLPKGIRVISPRAYCDLYKKRYKAEYLPERLCTKLQRSYEDAIAASAKAADSAKKP